MNKYENLQDKAHKDGVKIINHQFGSKRIKGLYCNDTIALSSDLETQAEKSCVLAEELGHHYTATGDITDQNSVRNRRTEQLGRLWAYNKMIGLMGIVQSYRHGCQSRHEIAEYLEVTEEFLSEALERYRQKYGRSACVDNYVIFFEPSLSVLEII